ncbi:DUF6343 family protein [Streptomyces eurythermus]
MSERQHGRPTTPSPRSRSAPPGGRAPRTGGEPVTARSALRLRLLLGAVFLPVFAAATAGFAVWAAREGPGDSPGTGPLTALAVICGLLALGAAADLAVVSARRRRSSGGRPPTD